MKYIRYPLLFLLVVIIPPVVAQVLSRRFIWQMIGYILSYVFIFGCLTLINWLSKETIYSKKIRTTYLVLNAILFLVLVRIFIFGTALLYMTGLLGGIAGIFSVGLPIIGVQLLFLHFFVRYERLKK